MAAEDFQGTSSLEPATEDPRAFVSGLPLKCVGLPISYAIPALSYGKSGVCWALRLVGLLYIFWCTFVLKLGEAAGHAF